MSQPENGDHGIRVKPQGELHPAPDFIDLMPQRLSEDLQPPYVPDNGELIDEEGQVWSGSIGSLSPRSQISNFQIPDF